MGLRNIFHNPFDVNHEVPADACLVKIFTKADDVLMYGAGKIGAGLRFLIGDTYDYENRNVVSKVEVPNRPEANL